LRRSAALACRIRRCNLTARKDTGEQPCVSGATPGYADYIVFSIFQYARLGCADEFLGDGTALRRWRDGLVQAFDGLGDRYPGYPTHF